MSIDYFQLELTARPGAFSRFDMEAIGPYLEKIPDEGVYLEVGVDKGRSLQFARSMTKLSIKVCGIDIQNDPLVDGTKFCQGDSVDIARVWPKDLKIDVLFIDGDHSYEGCKRDIEAWKPLVKEGGVIFFHDCDETSPGVMKAVNEYFPGKVFLYKTPAKNTSMARVDI